MECSSSSIVENDCKQKAVCYACLQSSKNINELTSDVSYDMFAQVTGIEFEDCDRNAIVLCEQCVHQLKLAYDFRTLCRKSYETLQVALLQSQAGIAEIVAAAGSRIEIEQLNSEEEDEDDEEKEEEDMEAKTGVKPHKRREKVAGTLPRLKQFPYDDVIAVINEVQTVNESTVCALCGFVGSHQWALSGHVAAVHKDERHRWCHSCCEWCDDLTEHVNRPGQCRKKVLQCRFCHKEFTTKNRIVEHLQCHAGIRPYNCDSCTLTFLTTRHLKQHAKRHYATKEGNKALSGGGNREARNEMALCTVCGKQFADSTKLRIHMRIHTGEYPYKCQYCEKRMGTRHQVVVHERTHTGEKPHICCVCGKGFTQTSILNTHMKLHTGRTEECQVCKKRFCRPAELRVHMRRHTGEKPFVCDICKQSFTQRCTLIDHLRTHSDVRAHQCPYCDKAFKQAASLKSHQKLHLGKKMYQCSQCSFACRQSFTLTKHMRQHVNDLPQEDRPHACMVCSRTFTTIAMLNSHTLSVHDIPAVLFEVEFGGNQ